MNLLFTYNPLGLAFSPGIWMVLRTKEQVRKRWLFFFFTLKAALSNGRNGATSQWDSLSEQFWLLGASGEGVHNGYPWRSQSISRHACHINNNSDIQDDSNNIGNDNG